MSQGAPRRIADPLARVVREQAPRTLLAQIQVAWPDAAGPAIAAASEPVAERQGRVTIACVVPPWIAAWLEPAARVTLLPSPSTAIPAL